MRNLRQLCLKSPRLNEIDDYMAFRKEIGAIELHKLEGYFLDIYNKKIKVTNTSNSIVAYLIGITDEKPKGSLRYKGGALPDIDVDVSDKHRDKVVDYIISKYGDNATSGIGAHGYFWAKNSIRFVGKALGYDLDLVTQVANAVPPLKQGKNWHIDEAVKESEELRALMAKNPAAKEIVHWSSKIDGTIGNVTQHAAGIVITDTDLNCAVPMWRNPKGNAVAEFEMGEIEDLGFVKADLLGLRTLTVIEDCLNLINSRHNTNLTVDNIPLDDVKTFNYLSTGLLMGIFQLEGEDISDFTKRFAPKDLQDVVLISAGYRPGPLQFLDEILTIRNGGQWKKIEPTGVKFPIISDVLSNTSGYLIYQEQIQKVVELLADYSDVEADEFRKTISKKIHEKMVKEKVRFSKKAKEKGMSDKDINELWQQMEDFASYSFNYSHALAYSVITVKTAYLKAHYPVEFYTANIMNEMQNQEKVTSIIEEANLNGIKILGPDINESNADFTIVDSKTIRFGLSGISEVGRAASDPIIEERTNNGPFKSLSDLIWRCSVRSNVVKKMIYAGCFDTIGKRSQYLYEYEPGVMFVDNVIDLCSEMKKRSIEPINIEDEVFILPDISEYTLSRLIYLEKISTGLYISSSPFKIYRHLIDRAVEKGGYAGLITAITPFKSGTGGAISLKLPGGFSLACLAFRQQWTNIKNNPAIQPGVLVRVSGKYDASDEEDVKLFINDIELIVNADTVFTEDVIIDIDLNENGLLKMMDLQNNIPFTSGEARYIVCLSLNGSRSKALVKIGATNTNL